MNHSPALMMSDLQRLRVCIVKANIIGNKNAPARAHWMLALFIDYASSSSTTIFSWPLPDTTESLLDPGGYTVMMFDPAFAQISMIILSVTFYFVCTRWTIQPSLSPWETFYGSITKDLNNNNNSNSSDNSRKTHDKNTKSWYAAMIAILSTSASSSATINEEADRSVLVLLYQLYIQMIQSLWCWVRITGISSVRCCTLLTVSITHCREHHIDFIVPSLPIWVDQAIMPTPRGRQPSFEIAIKIVGRQRTTCDSKDNWSWFSWESI